ncbi:hypothetical protein [Actinomadura roseirufa]|uniref:hypothetical protein n=1 Tax=Actinomadura roseirufa TaxID=2094049 RepID=UPI001041741B|nr:hypothetical protein [Actinomadura roseirufa]
MNQQSTGVSAITFGADRVRRSLIPRPRTGADYVADEPSWRSGFVADLPADPPRRRMRDFGYRDHELHGTPSRPDEVAMAGPLRLLTDEGLAHLVRICANLAPVAVTNDYVVTRRLRGVETISPFVHDMVRDPAFLALVSDIVGVPLIPHPIRDAAVQINYYTSAGGDAEVAKWHLDGMNYVFTMTLTDRSEHDGGDYIYFQGHRADFDLHSDGIRAAGEHHPQVAKAPFTRAGDTMFTRGSRIYHAVTPLTRGFRTTLAVSLFCPLYGAQDENHFWHSAPDDGLLRTVKNWIALHLAMRSPMAYCRRNHIPRPASSRST